jgi:hypothetical protein
MRRIYSIDLPYTKKTSKMGVAQTWFKDPFLLMMKSEVTALSFCEDYTINLRSGGIMCPTRVKLHKPAQLRANMSRIPEEMDCFIVQSQKGL